METSSRGKMSDNEAEEEHEKSDLEEAEAGDDLELEGEGGSEVCVFPQYLVLFI